LVFEGESVTPVSGWVDVHVQPGWDSSNRWVWWLPKDGAVQCWDIATTGYGYAAVSDVPREMGTWWMQWLLALDRVRTVPKFNRSQSPNHDRDSGEDFTIIEMQVAMTEPELQEVDYSAVPTLWRAMRGPYGRDVASVIATAIGMTPEMTPQGWEFDRAFGKRDLQELARVWLEPEMVQEVPPPLVRHAVLSIGTRGWQEHRQLLEKLLRSLGEKTDEEKELNKITETIHISMKEKGHWFYYDVDSDPEAIHFQKMDKRLRHLENTLTGSPGFELRESIVTALRMLDCYDDKNALEAWSKEKSMWSSWAAERLKEI